MHINKNDILTVDILDTTIYGTGVAKIEDFIVFVDDCTKGDTVKIKINTVKKKFAFAIILDIISSGNLRLDEDCCYNTLCGGCSLRHISYDYELEVKQNSIKSNLRKIANIDFDVNPCISSYKIERYRNKCVYQFLTTNNIITTGFFAKKSHNIIDVKTCLLEPHIFTNIRESVAEFFTNKKVSTYNYETQKGILKYLLLRIDTDNIVFLGLVINGDTLPFADDFILFMKNEHPIIKNIFININKNHNGTHLGRIFKDILTDKTHLTYDILDTKLKVSKNSFFQVNTDTTNILYDIIKNVADIQDNDIVLDLYCGVGSIGLCVTKNSSSLYGVEIIDSAIEDAIHNATINGFKNAHFFSDTAENIYKHLLKDNIIPTVAILDPPRSGCNINLLNTLIDYSPSKIVMVSCDSSTMCRDIKILMNNNYRLKSVTPVNMFPKTSHVESVVLMTKIK